MARTLLAVLATIGTVGTLPAAPPLGGRLAALGQGTVEPARKLESREVYERMLRSTVWIWNEANDSVGTGWVLDAERGLIVTNQHVVVEADEVKTYFPEYEDGKLVTDAKYYDEHVVPEVGEVLDVDYDRDLAIVRVSKLPAGIEALDLAPRGAEGGDRLYALAGFPRGSGGLWIFSTGIVRQVLDRVNANGGFGRMVESDMATNKGNSGGAVVNDRGQVVAVVEGHMGNARLVSIYVDLTELRAYLDEALPLLDAADAESLVTRGKRLLEAGRYEAAIRDFTAATLDDAESARAFALRGLAFYRNGDAETARGDLDEAIRLDRNLPDAHHALGLVLRDEGDNDGAIKAFSSAIRADPDSERYYNERGIAHYYKAEYAKAERDYGRAIERSPKDAVLWANRGDARQQLGRHGDAVVDYTEAVELAPFRHDYVNRLGVNHYHLGKLDEAAGFYRRAIALDATPAVYHSNLGHALFNLGRHSEAISAYTDAIQRESNEAVHYADRGSTFSRLKRFTEAIIDLNRAIELKSDVARFHNLRGLAHQGAGLVERARADFARAAKLDPEKFGGNEVAGRTEPAEQPKPAPKLARKVPANALAPFAGLWRHQGQVQDHDVTIAVAMNDRGDYAAAMKATRNGQVTDDDEEQGRFRIDGDRLLFETNGEVTTRKFEFEDGMLWIHFPEWELHLRFRRVEEN